MPVETGGPLAGRLAAAEARLARTAPGFLDRVREAANRLAVRDTTADDLQAAMSAIDELAIIDLDVPTASRIPIAGFVKKAVKRLVGWYLGYFGRQLTAFGQAVINLGSILVERTDRLQSEAGRLRADLARLTERVERLEDGGPGRR